MLPFGGETASAGGGRRMVSNRRMGAARTGVRHIAVYFRKVEREFWALQFFLGQVRLKERKSEESPRVRIKVYSHRSGQKTCQRAFAVMIQVVEHLVHDRQPRIDWSGNWCCEVRWKLVLERHPCQEKTQEDLTLTAEKTFIFHLNRKDDLHHDMLAYCRTGVLTGSRRVAQLR